MTRYLAKGGGIIAATHHDLAQNLVKQEHQLAEGDAMMWLLFCRDWQRIRRPGEISAILGSSL